MIFGYFTLFVALLIEVVGAYYSITGLAAIFSGAVIPILIMGGVLEVGKVTAAVWLKNNWHRASVQFKLYLLPAVTLLMFITSMGIFGFLSKAHNDQNLVSGDVLSKIAIYDEKIKIQRDNIDSARRALQQMDAAVDQTMSRSTGEQGADKATAIRRGQARERSNLQKEITRAQTEIVSLNDQRAPIAAEVRKVEAEVGPIKYIAKMIYGDNPDANLLEQAVVWVIMMIVAVFDPLALVLILAAQQSIRWARGEVEEPRGPNLLDKLRNRFKRQEEQPADSTFVSVVEDLEPVFDRETEIPDYTDYSEGTLVATQDPAPTEETEPVEEPAVEEKKTRWAGFGFPLLNHFTQPKVETFREGDYCSYFPQENVKEIINAPGLDASDERPGDYVESEPTTYIREAVPGVNRGVRQTFDVPAVGHKHKVQQTNLSAPADNAPALGKASNSGFGSEYPKSPEKGDVYLRTDSLPNRLFKFNGKKWIEVDKNSTDVYAYEEAYIRHLITEIDAGRYDADTLTDVEREQIAEYLRKNA